MASIKLSITVRQHLSNKYSPAALGQIDSAVKNWIAADAARGVQTLHVAVDVAADMDNFGMPPVSGTISAEKVKRAVDAIWRQLNPDYLVLFGGHEIVPMFSVPNPSYDHARGDDDADVPTDNPYACSKAFQSGVLASYLVADRVVGRIPDLIGDADPAWLLKCLETATTWAAQPASAYADPFAICCDEWAGAGQACMRYLSLPSSGLLISPPTLETSPAARQRLSALMHLIKCHGSKLDPYFYGQRGGNYPKSVYSGTLRATAQPRTVAGAMCCYGAQVYDRHDPTCGFPGDLPIASTYLRQGAYGLAGATRIAWVGVDQMMCADWIASDFLKRVLGGASTGRALLEAKQQYIQWFGRQGTVQDVADEKTLIEYVLLGDPSIHPVGIAPKPVHAPPKPKGPTTKGAGAAAAMGAPEAAVAAGLVAAERRQRRVALAATAKEVRKGLPKRSNIKPPADPAAVLKAALALLGEKGAPEGIKAGEVLVQALDTPLPPAPKPRAAGATASRAVAAMAKAAPKHRRSIHYYWSTRHVDGPVKRITLTKAETDPEGNVLRVSVVVSS